MSVNFTKMNEASRDSRENTATEAQETEKMVQGQVDSRDSTVMEPDSVEPLLQSLEEQAADDPVAGEQPAKAGIVPGEERIEPIIDDEPLRDVSDEPSAPTRLEDETPAAPEGIPDEKHPEHADAAESTFQAEPAASSSDSAVARRRAARSEEDHSDSPFASSPIKEVTREDSAPTVRLEFKSTKRTTSKVVVLDSAGGLVMIRGTEVHDLDNIRNVPGYGFYLAELDQSFGLMNVTGDPRYAAVMGRKELEDRGELTLDAQLFVHGTQKIDATQSMVIYSVFSRQRYAGIASAYKEHTHGFELFDPVGLLYGLLRTLPRSRPHALALRTGGTLVLLVGRKDEVLLVRQYSTYGLDDESMAESVSAMAQDVSLLEGNLGMQVSQINWIETFTHDLDIRIPETQIPFYAWPVTRLTFQGREAWSALPSVADRVPVRNSVGPREERYLKPMDTAVNWLLAAGVMLILAFGAGAYLYSTALDQLRAGSGDVDAAYQRELAELRGMEVRLRPVDTEAFLNTAESVEQAVLAPTMGEMWNVLAATRPETFLVQGMELRYERDRVLVRLEGTMNETIGTAQEAFANYIVEMERLGFVLVDQNLNMDLERIDYLLQLQWPIRRG